jgi:hypothetical protein
LKVFWVEMEKASDRTLIHLRSIERAVAGDGEAGSAVAKGGRTGTKGSLSTLSRKKHNVSPLVTVCVRFKSSYGSRRNQ